MNPITYSNTFIQQFSESSFQENPFITIQARVEELEMTNDVPLHQRMELIEKLSYCWLIAVSQWEVQQKLQEQRLNWWDRLLRFLGFSCPESLSLPVAAVNAQNAFRRVMEGLSGRLDKYNYMLGFGVDLGFKKLRDTYSRSISFTSGSGLGGQIFIDNAHIHLEDFIAYNPEYQDQLPKKHICRNDGQGGTLMGIASLAAFHRNHH